MKRTLYIIFAFITLTVSCTPENIIDREDMANIYYDFYMSDAYLSDLDMMNLGDSVHIYIPIIEKYGYTFEQYQTSVDHYLHKPEILIKIFKEVEDRMKEREKALEIIVDKEYMQNIRWSLLDSLDRCADKNLKGNSMYRALNLIFFEADTPKVTSPEIDSAILNHIISPYYLYDTVPTMYDSITLEEYILNKSFESRDTALIKNRTDEKSHTFERGRFRKQTLIKKDFDR